MPIKPARLEICEECSSHGHIVFSDETESKEFVIKKDCLALITEALRDKKITPEESNVLEQELRESYLPETEESALAFLAILQKLSEVGKAAAFFHPPPPNIIRNN